METVKKNLVSIICGVVALLAMVFVFYPLGGFFEDLQQQLDASASTNRALDDLNRKQHFYPITELGEEPKPLEIFPNPKAIKTGQAAVARIVQQADDVLKAALEMNRRPFLVPAALPSPRGIAAGSFKNAYHERIAQLKAAMRATMPPTQLELTALQRQLWEDEYEKQVHKVGGVEMNRADVQAKFQVRVMGLPEEVKQDRAKKYQMYVSSEKTLNVHPIIPSLEAGGLPDVMDIWAAQLSMWIAEDVVTAIIQTNKEAGGPVIETAAVKRLVRLDIPKRYITTKGELPFATDVGAGGMANMMQMPNPAMMMNPMLGGPNAAAAPVEPDTSGPSQQFMVSSTGRVCNVLYDVMHFTVVVDTDASKFREFMANLTKNKFISIIKVEMAAVDRDKELQRGFIYGRNPVVRVSLKCEAIFFRSWTTKFMPNMVKQMLRVPEDPAPVAMQ